MEKNYRYYRLPCTQCDRCVYFLSLLFAGPPRMSLLKPRDGLPELLTSIQPSVAINSANREPIRHLEVSHKSKLHISYFHFVLCSFFILATLPPVSVAIVFIKKKFSGIFFDHKSFKRKLN